MPCAPCSGQLTCSDACPSIFASAPQSHRAPWRRRCHPSAATGRRLRCGCPLPRLSRGSASPDLLPVHGRWNSCHRVRPAVIRDDHARLSPPPWDKDGPDCSCHPFRGRRCRRGGYADLRHTRSDHRHPRRQRAYRRNSGRKEQRTEGKEAAAYCPASLQTGGGARRKGSCETQDSSPAASDFPAGPMRPGEQACASVLFLFSYSDEPIRH